VSLEGQIAIITGGTGGLGQEVVLAFLKGGASVVVPYRKEPEVIGLIDKVGKGLERRLTTVRADLTKEREVKKLVAETADRLGRIDILINLVGGFVGGNSIVDTEEATWDLMMNINLKTAFLCCKSVLRYMIKQDYGKIVNVSSRPALEGAPGIGAYAVSKAGVIILTKTIAEEVKKHNINANIILPSTIDTPQNRASMSDADFSRWVKPEDITQVILFLVSEEAKTISGAAVPVYGKASS